MFVDVEQYGTFNLDPEFLEPYRNEPVDWGYGALSWATFKRTYSRDGEDWWETCRRVIEGMFTVQRVHCLERNLPWNDDKARRFAHKAYDRLFHFKWTPPGRGLWMMGTDYIYERGGAALNNCFAGETEIVTADGTKTLEECAGTTQTLLSRNGEWVDAPIRSFGEQELMRVTLSRQGRQKVVYATPDHRWFAVDRRQAHRDKGHVEFTTEELRPGVHRLQYVFGQNCKSVPPSSFGIAHGIAYGDGASVPGEGNANHLMLCGENNRQLARYFELCPKTERPDACEEGGVRIGGLPNFFNEKPSLDETKSYLYGWLAGYVAADGTCTANGQVRLTSASRENLEFVRDVCYVLGIGTYGIREEERGSNLTESDRRSMYEITFMRDTLDEDFFLIDTHRQHFRDNSTAQKQYWNVESVERTDRKEEVYCATVEDKGAFALADNILTGNCGFVSTKDIDRDFADPFTWMFNMSMLGVGIGFDTRGKGERRIQAPDRADDTHVIGDSREGWAEALGRLLNAFVGEDTMPAEWDYSEIRPKGAPLESFGGVASGPDPLEKMLETLEEMYTAYIGDLVDAQLIVDTMNIAGRCVVAGGIRRTAQIAFGDKEDEQFLDLKLDDEKVRAYRWASNNSIFADVGMDYSDVAERTGVNGEPGYLWLENARAYGRMKDDPNWDDEQAEGANPCNEQTLWDHELCTLVETYPAHHESFEDFRETLRVAYQYAKTVTLVGTHDKKTNAVMLRNRRIGCSVTGIVQAINKHGYREFFDWCDEGYDYIQELDDEYSDWLCVPKSIKTTSVKPSGCRPWHSLTATDEGLLTLQELFDISGHREDEEWSDMEAEVSVLQGDETNAVTKTYDNGTETVYRVTMSYGLRIEVTGNHPLCKVAERLPDGAAKHELPDGSRTRYKPMGGEWMPARRIESGDVLKVDLGTYDRDEPASLEPLSRRAISMRADATSIAQPEAMNEDLAWLLGYLWGDGAMSPSKYRLRFMDEDRERIERAAATFCEQFDVDPRIGEASEGRNAHTLTVASKMLWHWLIRNDVWKYFADEIDLVPQVVRESRRRDVLAFLAGLVDADGHAHVTSQKGHGKFTVSTASERFSQHLQDVAWSVGIGLGCSHDERGPNKQQRKSMYLLTLSTHVRPESFETLKSYSSRLQALEEDEAFDGWQWDVGGRGHKIGRVESVETIGEQPTFDIEVEDEHWYYAGPVKSHNTVSILAGATPGVHWDHSPYYLRRVRVAESHELVEACEEAGYPVEADPYADDTMIIGFPVKVDDIDRGKGDVSLREKVDLAAQMQHYWSDNQVSCTAEFDPDTEAEEIPQLLAAYEDRLKGISFLPMEDHGYDKPPYEEISKERYEELMSQVGSIEGANLKHDQEDKFCDSASCDVEIDDE